MSSLVLKQQDYDPLLIKQPELKAMVESINKTLPEIERAKNNFGKSQTQYMDNMLTVSHATPLRNLRQILAEVEKIQQALRETYFKQQKTKIKLQMKLRSLNEEQDDLKKELIQVSVSEIRSQIEASEIYIAGAIRAMANYTSQYNNIANKLMEDQGVTEFSELDLEAEEEKYHITKAFEQALCAARSHGGIIDEGNHIYFYQIGINGAAAQMEVLGLLRAETQLLESGQVPPHSLVRDFLQAMTTKFAGCSAEMAASKGMTVCSPSATVAPKLVGTGKT